MKSSFSPKNNPRVIIIQKLYGKFFNEDEQLNFPKHRFKKFIKDTVSGTIERNEIILDELDKNLGENFNLGKLDKVFQIILKSATKECNMQRRIFLVWNIFILMHGQLI